MCKSRADSHRGRKKQHFGFGFFMNFINLWQIHWDRLENTSFLGTIGRINSETCFGFTFSQRLCKFVEPNNTIARLIKTQYERLGKGMQRNFEWPTLMLNYIIIIVLMMMIIVINKSKFKNSQAKNLFFVLESGEVITWETWFCNEDNSMGKLKKGTQHKSYLSLGTKELQLKWTLVIGITN